MVELFPTEPFHKKGYQHFCPFYGKFDKALGKDWDSLEDTLFRPYINALQQLTVDSGFCRKIN